MAGAYDVHVYTIPLDVGEQDQARILEGLSEQERNRAQRFVFARDRCRYSIAHRQTRRLLGLLTKTPSGELAFRTLPGGKPIIHAPAHARRWHFNLSHSGSFALLAVTDAAPVGIDIERKRALPEHESIADTFFSPLEREAYLGLPEPLRVQGFFSIWTRKEAFIKALGLGLALPLDAFDVSTPERWFETPRLRSNLATGRSFPAHDWRIHPLSVPEDYAGAVAIRAQGDINIVYGTADTDETSAALDRSGPVAQ